MTDSDFVSSVIVGVSPPQQLKSEVKVSRYSTVSKIRTLTGITENPPTDDVIGLVLSYAITFTKNKLPSSSFDGLDDDTKELLVTLCAGHILMRNKIAGSLYTGVVSFGVGGINISKSPLAVDANAMWTDFQSMIDSIRPVQQGITQSERSSDLLFSDGYEYI